MPLPPKSRRKHHETPVRKSSVAVQIECRIRAAIGLGEQDEVAEADIAISVEVRIVRMLERRGLLEPESADSLWQDEPLLASLTAMSIQGTVRAGARAGQRIPLLFIPRLLPTRGNPRRGR